jgi:peptide/nickel transport system permease protein
LGISASKHAGTLWDNAVTAFSLIGLSMPVFWLGLLLLIWFSNNLQIFPAGGYTGFSSLVLPAITTGLLMASAAARQTRSSMLEIQRQDFLRTARAKGVSERVVTNKHQLGNAWIPIVTTIGDVLSRVLAGSAVVETVFSWPGIGRLTVEAVSQRDVTLSCGCVIMTCVIYVLILMVVDILYAFIDPRIKAQYMSAPRKKRKAGVAS